MGGGGGMALFLFRTKRKRGGLHDREGLYPYMSELAVKRRKKVRDLYPKKMWAEQRFSPRKKKKNQLH